MGAIIPLPNAASPVERVLGRFSRTELEGFIAVAIELLDLADGDPDTERNGDELDGSLSEEDFVDWSNGPCVWDGPGCPVADPGGCGTHADQPDAIVAGFVPTYGVDQDAGPVTEAEAGESYAAADILQRRRER
jgi:hypothetical protein